MVPQVSHSLIAQRTETAGTGLSIRVRNTINPELVRDLLKEVKALGCTVTHLFGAAQILAIFELNPVMDEQAPQANIAFPISMCVLRFHRILGNSRNCVQHLFAILANSRDTIDR